MCVDQRLRWRLLYSYNEFGHRIFYDPDSELSKLKPYNSAIKNKILTKITYLSNSNIRGIGIKSKKAEKVKMKLFCSQMISFLNFQIKLVSLLFPDPLGYQCLLQ